MANEKRLIDADALHDKVYYWIRDGEFVTLQDVRYAIVNAPTVDAVEVVRCKDCEHWKEHDGEMFCHCYANLMTDTAPYDFCSYGEVKGVRENDYDRND